MKYKTKDFIKNIGICNIHLMQINDLREYSRECLRNKKIGDYVWVCGKHGYEGVLNDGGISLIADTIEELLDKIISFRKLEEKIISQENIGICISSAIISFKI